MQATPVGRSKNTCRLSTTNIIQPMGTKRVESDILQINVQYTTVARGRKELH